MAFRFALLALLTASATSLVLQTTKLKSFGSATSALHPDATAKLLASIQDSWKTLARNPTSDSFDSFAKSCKTVASAVVSGSDGDHDRVQKYMAEVCQQSSLDQWHMAGCQKFKGAMGKSMTFDNYANRANFNFDSFCSAFFKDFSAEETAAAKVEEEHRLVEEKAELEKELAQKKVDAAKAEEARKAKEEARKAEEEAAAWRAQKVAELKKADEVVKAKLEQHRLAQEAAKAKEAEEKEHVEQKKMLRAASERSAALRKEKAAKALVEAQEAAAQAGKVAAEHKATAEKAAKVVAEAKAEVANAKADAKA